MAKTSGQFKQEFVSLRNRMTNFATGLGRSQIGQAGIRGVGMGLGWSYGAKNVSEGFLGLGKAGRAANTGKSFLGKVGGAAFKGIPLVFTLMGIYQGYQEEGVWGGVKGGLEGEAGMAAWEMASAALGGMMIPGAIAAVGYGAYKYADTARNYGKSLKQVNMGAPLVDQFGTVATTRQRSLQALQNTHINGRMALGNEGMLIHNNIYGRR